jgi:FKBP-type peptidyl-prolyl cis-trans isomerase
MMVFGVLAGGGGCPGPFGNSNPTVNLKVDKTEIPEDEGVATVTATLDAVTSRPVTVHLAYSGTAESGKDYTRSSMTITIPPFASTGTVRLTGVKDQTYDGDRTVIVDIASVTNGTAGSDKQVTVTIKDKPTDEPAQVILTLLDTSGNNQQVTEGTLQEPDGEIKVFAQLTAPPRDEVTVNLAFGGTATDADYTASDTKIVLPVNSSTGLAEGITIKAKSDPGYDNGETIIITIASVINATEVKKDGEGQKITITKLDEEPAPVASLAADPLSIAENGGTATITATLSKTVLVPVVIGFSFSGTAVKDTDYTVSDTKIDIPAGETTGSITLTAKDDGVYGGNQTIQVKAEQVRNASPSGSGQFTITIEDSTPAPTVTLEPKTFSLSRNGGKATLTATLSAASAVDATVYLNISGDVANGEDFTADPDSLIRIPAGQTSGSMTITGIGSDMYQGSVQFTVNIVRVTNAREDGVQEAVGVLYDDKTPPKVTLSLSGSPFAENGGVAIVTATMAYPSYQSVTVNLGFTGANQDVTWRASATQITIPPERISGAITLHGIDDGVEQGDQTITVDITSVTNGSKGDPHQVIATVSDTLPTLALSLTGSPMAEDGGVATVTATLSKAVGVAVTAHLGFAGSAVKGTDYTASDTQIEVLAGQTTGTLTLTSIHDTLYEGDETVVVTVTQLENAAYLGTNQVTAVITDAFPEQNLAAGQAWLADNATKPGVVVLPSGLQYKILVAGTGPKPVQADTVNVKYTGTLIDGTVFDSSDSATFQVSGVIEGWTEALLLMPVGSQWMLYIPADLAYGATPRPKIPPNSVLIFDVTLLGIK